MRILLRRNGESAAGQVNAMFSAIQSLNAQGLEVVLDLGISPNSKDVSNTCNVHWNVKDQAKLALFCASFPYMMNINIKDSVPLVKLLIERGANLYSPLNDRETLTHYVFEHSEYEIVCALMECSDRIDFDRRDQLGRTVFLAACNFTNTLPGFKDKHWFPKESGPAIKILGHSADLTAVDNEGKTALHHLLNDRGAEKDDILFFLKQDFSRTLLKQKDDAGFAPLHCALCTLRPAVCDTLIAMGTELLEPYANGATAIHHIASQWFEASHGSIQRNNFQKHPRDYYEGCIRLWDMFLQQGGDVNTRDDAGRPALFSYLSSPPKYDYEDKDPESCCHASSLERFFEHADFYARNDDGETALHIIARRQKTHHTRPKHDSKLFEVMVGKGLDPLTEDNKGRSSLDVAAACEQKEILELFKYRS